MMNKALILAALVIPAAARADGLPKQVADLERLVGTWKGSGTLAMGKDKAKVDVTISCKRTSAQFGILCNTKFTGIPGVPSYDETDLFGYEPNSNTYHWFSVTNGAETHDHIATTIADKVQFVYTGTQEGKPMKEAIDIDFGKDGKAMAFHVDTTVGGAIVASMDVKTRK